MINPENLISLTDFAIQAGLKPSQVTRLISPQQIKTVDIAGKKFIDTSVYDPNDFKPKPKKDKS